MRITTPFKTAARYLMPALTTSNVVVPAIVVENMITSIETRVIAPTPTPNPVVAYPRIAGGTTVNCLPALVRHPCNLVNTAAHIRSLKLEVILRGTPTKKQVLLLAPTPMSAFANCDESMLPMADPSSCWTIPDQANSEFAFLRTKTSYLSRQNQPTCLPKLSTVFRTTLSPWHLADTSTLNKPTSARHTIRLRKQASARDTPLRDLVEEFLRAKENRWLDQVTEPIPFEEWLKRYPEVRRAQLRAARDEVLRQGEITSKDAVVKNFLKRETTSTYVDPRNISPRSDAFLAILGPYISAIEHKAIRNRYLVKGLTPRQRAKKVDWLVEFGRFLEIDYSRFDMTISPEIINIFELAVLKKPFPFGEHALYHQALDHTLRTSGISSFGTRYNREGGRCSGDAHTSIGNGLLNYFLTWVCLRGLPQHAWRSVHEGDDGIVGFQAKYWDQVRANMAFLDVLGFKVKLKLSKNVEEVVFCGRHFFWTSEGMREMADVPRSLKKFNTTMSLGRNKILLLAKALSYNYTDADTPLLGALTYSLVRVLRDDPECQSPRRLRSALAAIKAERWMIRDAGVTVTADCAHRVRPPRVPPEARAVCALTDGISFHLQQALEKEYLGWVHLGHVPSEITKLLFDWEAEPVNVVTYGDITKFYL